MVKDYNKELLEQGILEFETDFHSFREDKSSATITPPFPMLKKLGINNKETKMVVRITKKEV